MYLDYGMYSDSIAILTLLSNIVNSFMMPLFFLISGCSFGLVYIYSSEKNGNRLSMNKEKIKLQIINLIVIYFFWSIIYCIAKLCLSNDALDPVTGLSFTLMPFKAISLFWYLYVLVICYAITYVAINEKIRIRVLIIFSVTIGLLQYWITYRDIEQWTITKTSMYLLFFELGILAIKFPKFNNAIKERVFIIISFVLSALSLISIWYVCYRNMADSRFIWTDIPVIGIFPTVFLVLSICGIFMHYDFDMIPINVIGKYSLEIYLIHRFVMMAFRKIITHFCISNFAVAFIGCLFTCIMVPMAAACVLKRIKLYNLFFAPKNFIRQVSKIE